MDGPLGMMKNWRSRSIRVGSARTVGYLDLKLHHFGAIQNDLANLVTGIYTKSALLKLDLFEISRQVRVLSVKSHRDVIFLMVNEQSKLTMLTRSSSTSQSTGNSSTSTHLHT